MKLDTRIREFMAPVRVLMAEGVENAEILLREADQIGLNEKVFAKVQGKARILLDFGKELHGALRIVTGYGTEGAPVHLRLGESVGEAVSPLGTKGSTNNHSLRDMTVPLSILSDMEFFCSGFRFAYLEFTDENAKFCLKAVNAVYIHNARPQTGSFRCSDELINKIYDTAAYTVQLCAQDYIWDGIKRDRLVWIGDIYPEMRALLSVCADDGCITKSLDFVKNETPLPAWMNAFPMYSMWWLIILCDYYKLTGNLDYILSQKEYMVALLEQIDGCIAENGDFDFGTNFVDWPTHEQPDEPEGVRCLCRICADRAEELEKLCGRDGSLSRRIRAKMDKKDVPVQDKKQIVALKYFSRTALSEKEKKLLTENGAKGFSTFMSYFLLSALSENADMEQTLNALKEYYGGMLKMGATTFWEDFDVDWMENSCPVDRLCKEGERDIHGDFGRYCYIGYRHSLCHGWSAGVIPFLLERVIGVKIDEAGYKKVTVSPDLGSLTWFDAQIPTPAGLLKISCKKENGKVKTTVDAPEGCKVNVVEKN